MRTTAPWIISESERAEIYGARAERVWSDEDVKRPRLVPVSTLLAWLAMILFCLAMWWAVIFFSAACFSKRDEPARSYRPIRHEAVTVVVRPAPSAEIIP